tara:strand:- start:4740 stop:6131 length:1392 start_codon:yes stop_codon:yes gene_type:complete
MKNNLIKKIDNLMKSAQSSKEMGDFSSALFNFNEILNIDRSNKKALNNIANVYKEMKHFDEAIKYYSKALVSDPDYIIAKINLAVLHHDLGNLDEAEKFYKEIINLDKNNLGVYFNLSRININYFNKAKIKFIENLVIDKNISNYNKASGYFILAKKQEQIKNFDKEILFLKMGHEFFLKSIPIKNYQHNTEYWLNIIPKKFSKIKINDSDILNKENENINPIFIIGMPRSGSTLVESIISSGNLKIPNGGETAVINWALLKNRRNEFFNDSLENIDIDYKDLKNNVLEKYKSLNLVYKNDGSFFTDKSLENFFYIDIILSLFPKAKFINCRRNNVDNIFAIYQNFLTKMTWTHSIKDIINYFDNYLTTIDYYNKKYKDKIFQVQLEELTTNSKKISKDLFNFCNLKWSEKSLEFHKRKDLFSSTASNIQIREKIFKYNKEKYLAYEKYIKEFSSDFHWLKKD